MHYLWSDEQTIKKTFMRRKSAKANIISDAEGLRGARESFMAFRKIKKGGSKM